MLKAIFYIVWIMNILCVITKCKSRVLNTLSFLVLILVFGGNTANSDYSIYEREYYLSNTKFEVGYEFITNIFCDLGLSYNHFLFILAIAMYGIIFYVYTKYSKNYAVFYTIYFSVFLFYDINQVRNFIAMALLLLACDCLINGKRKISLGLILLAAQFQSIAYIYLPISLMNLEKKQTKKFYRTAVVVILVICVFIFLCGNKIPFLETVFALFVGGEESSKMYYFENSVRFGFLLSYALQFMNVGMVYFANLIANKSEEIELYKKKFLNICMTINLYGFIAFPLVMINHNFYRIFRNFCVLDIIVAAIVFDTFARTGRYKLSKRNFKFLCYVVFYCAIWAVGIMYKYSDFTQINTILTNNMFF